MDGYILDRELIAMRHRDYSVDHDVDLEDVFSTPGHVGYANLDPDSSSSLSWDVTPSLTFEQEVVIDEDADADEDIDQSRVEELVDTEMGDVEEENATDWHGMKYSSRYISSSCSFYGELTFPK
ncbi:hypothetical protein FRC09_018244 [Ceratobasidium sp. 395]|nr:hypothetical protein FRC09_018244 [Ceratobasidium sp. 395]